TRVLLACAINDSHAAAADFFQNFVMTKTPLCVGHIGFCEDAFERLARSLAFGFKSLTQETVNTSSVIEPGCRAALWTFRQVFDFASGGFRSLRCFVHHAAAANAAHK